MKKYCLIYANCQNELIAKYLSRSRHFQQEYQIKRCPVVPLIQQKTTIPETLLKQAKLFIYQPVKESHGIRSTQHILSKLPSDCQCISFPPLYFKGYFPQYCKNPNNHVIKPNYPYGLIPHGDTNIISMLESGKSVAEIIEILSDPDFYSREFLLDNLNETLAELERRESQLSIKVSNFIRTHYRNNYLFHTQNHPTDILGIHVVNQIFKLVNIPDSIDEFSANNPQTETLNNFEIPIYPSVIKHLGLTFADINKVYKHGSYCTNRMTFARYITEYASLHLSNEASANSYYFQGIKFIQENNFTEATEALKKAIKSNPSNASYYRELGGALQKQHKLDQAEIVYKKALQLSPDWIEFYILLANILIEKDNLRAAILTCKHAINLDPENDKLYSFLGEILVDYGELNLAAAAYNQAIEINPDNISFYRCLGDIYQAQNNLDLAVFNYQKAIALAPVNGWLYIHLSKTLIKQNQLDQATNTCHEAANLKLKYKAPSYYMQLADVQLQIGQVDHALDSYQQVIKLNPDYTQQIFAHLGNLLQDKIALKTIATEDINQEELVTVE